MEVGKMLNYVLFVVIPIVAVIVYISLSAKFISECKEEITGTKFSVLGSLSNCIKLCWSKHNFGQDIYSDDCYLVKVNSSTRITKDEMESFFGGETKVYFDSLEPSVVYGIKIRYNSTGKEISLILFEKPA
ncbi:MAG: hypothetical protein QW040_00440 [Candidatus Aenigmatarchaeota archaeon]